MALPLTDNPFTVVTAVVAPALLTNACSVMSLGTSNRLARAVDRTRVVAAQMASLVPESPAFHQGLAQLRDLKTRTEFLLRSLQSLYAAIGAFAGACLITGLGAVLKVNEWDLAAHIAAVVALATSAFAVTSLALACTLMVRESRLAVQSLSEEAERAIARHTDHTSP